MFVTSTEFKKNVEKYLMLATNEDIVITKNGKSVVTVTSITDDKVSMAKSLLGVLPTDVSLEEAREERLSRYDRID